MRRRLLALVIAASGAVAAHAQDKPIQDNSFLLEEAYNQEPGVVQHFFKYQRPRSRDWSFTFTQEWPLGSQKHQLSYTLPLQRAGGHTGAGDVSVDYRYQLMGDGDAPLAVAPRLSLILPTGDERKDLGAGGTGFQFNLPVSVVLSPHLVTHFNAGATITPSARNADGASARTTDYNFGQSFVWLLRPRLNLLLETVWSSEQSVEDQGDTSRRRSLFVSPGVRWAYNLANDLQVVPGIAVPIGVGPSRRDYGIFLYLSFEHPFGRAR
jgi:hypothetical protein